MRELCIEHIDKELELCLNQLDKARELCISQEDTPRILCVEVTDVDVPALKGVFDSTFDSTFG